MTRFNKQVVVVTGGTTGIGQATAKAFVAEGARVIVTGRNEKTLAAARSELGSQVDVVASDTAKLEDIAALAKTLKAKYERIDHVFVNAGIAKFLPVDAVTPEFFDELFNVNVRGAFFATQHLGALIRDGGSIVFNTSVANELGMPGASVYGATKAALRSMARTFATELAPRKIRVNAVSPGPISTPLYGKLGFPAADLAGFEQQMRNNNPMKRFGLSEEVAKAVLFFASDATYTTGAELHVDGGLNEL
jgi:NAD(P)-dependent dehydrogenase (short-subunit alcohol dehydrogenase family)